MRTLSLLIGGLSALALSGCATQTEPPHSLSGSTWQFVTIDGAKATSNKARLAFRDDDMNANVGCNGMGGPWRIEGKRLIIGPIARTEMYCAGPVWNHEQAVATLLSAAPQFQLKGNRLELRSSGHAAELHRLPAGAGQ